MPQGTLDVKRIDKVGINLQLRTYKNKNGSINFPALFSIPNEKRIANMAEVDLGETIKIITVALTLTFETMNLSRPMQAFQILDLAEAIVDSSAEEDKPALEDLMLFLQKLVRGEYPGLYEGMDIPKFMERWAKYRDDRWEEGIRIRDQQNEYYKSLGDAQTFDRTYRKPETSFDEMLSNYNSRLQTKNDEIRALREEHKRNR